MAGGSKRTQESCYFMAKNGATSKALALLIAEFLKYYLCQLDEEGFGKKNEPSLLLSGESLNPFINLFTSNSTNIVVSLPQNKMF